MQRELVGLALIEQTRQGPRAEWSARQVPLGRTVRVVGLDTARPRTSPLSRALEREAGELGALDHPGIVRLVELRDSESGPLLVVEDVLPDSLAELAREPFGVEATVALGILICQALAHAHERGIVHGRLGASSVRFSREGAVKLEGFGQVTPRSDAEPIEELNRDGLSPETTIGQKPIPASDLFCVGALLYQALTASDPFGPPSDPGHPARVRTAHAASLLRTHGGLPTELRRVIERCLEKQPSDRPTSVREVEDMLAPLCDGSPEGRLRLELSSRGLTSPPTAFRTATTARARPGLGRVATFVVAATLGGGATLGLSTFLGRERAKEDRALGLDSIEKADAALLRVVASPWAHVVIDGVHRETTPFATPLRVAPGRHVVRLEHPNAPAEERIIEGRSGEAMLLDVQMRVERPRETAPELTPADDDSP